MHLNVQLSTWIIKSKLKTETGWNEDQDPCWLELTFFSNIGVLCDILTSSYFLHYANHSQRKHVRHKSLSPPRNTTICPLSLACTSAYRHDIPTVRKSGDTTHHTAKHSTQTLKRSTQTHGQGTARNLSPPTKNQPGSSATLPNYSFHYPGPGSSVTLPQCLLIYCACQTIFLPCMLRGSCATLPPTQRGVGSHTTPRR